MEVSIMIKVLDLTKSVYDICAGDMMAKSILINLGLKAVAAPKTMGAMKNRTLNMVVPIRGMGLDEVLSVFEEKGYTITGREALEEEE